MSPTVTSSLQPASCACDAAFGIAFTSESRFAAVGVWGIGIRLIEVETGETVALLEAARQPPAHLDLNFSSDDTLLTAAVDHAGFCVWDMRVIRRRLAALGLDWDQPPLPEAEATGKEMPPLISNKTRPMRHARPSTERPEARNARSARCEQAAF